MSITNAQYSALMRLYDYKQQSAARALSERTAEIYEKIPEIKALEEKKIDGYISGFFKNEADAVPAPSPSGIDAEISALLTANGYPADYLKPRYECEFCSDTGFINGEKCECFKRAEIGLLLEGSDLSGILEKENFGTFDLGYYSDDAGEGRDGLSPRGIARMAMGEAKAFALAIGSEGNDLMISGPTGSGKTFLTHCIAKEAIENSYSTVYFSSQELFRVLADDIFRRSNSGSSRYIYECDLLIIDDLGTELTNNFVSSALFDIINQRKLKNKSTVISTNLSWQDLQDTYSERVSSRLISNYNIIKLTGDDIRLKKRFTGEKN